MLAISVESYRKPCFFQTYPFAMIIRVTTTLFLFFIIRFAQAQDSVVLQLPSQYLHTVSTKANQLEERLDKKTDNVLLQMMKQEERMKRKLAKIDSLKAQEVFGDIRQKYQGIKERLLSKGNGKKYIPSLDTLSTSLKFLKRNPQLISQIKGGEQKLNDAMGKVHGLEDKFQKADELKKFLKERKQYLKDRLSEFGFVKQLKKLNKQIYYYSEQVNE